MSANNSLISLLGRGESPAQLQHVRRIPARQAVTVPWPDWAHSDLVEAYSRLGVASPWRHQVAGAEAAHDGRHVVIATGTASGKSLAYQLPAVDAVHRAELRVLANPGRLEHDGAVTLYLSPTKALAADQLAALTSLHLPTLRAATYDGDTPPRTVAGSVTTRTSSCAIRTCCTLACCPTTRGGPGSSSG